MIENTYAQHSANIFQHSNPPTRRLLLILLLALTGTTTTNTITDNSSSNSSTTLPRRRGARPLLRQRRHALAALGVAVLLLPRGPPAEPGLGLPRLEALDLAAALKQVADDGRVCRGRRRRRRSQGRRGLEVDQLVPEVKLLGVSGEQALEKGAALLAVAVRGAELEGGEARHEVEVGVRLGAEDLSGALEEGAGAVGLAGGRVQEVGVVDPDVGRLGAVLLDDLLKELARFL